MDNQNTQPQPSFEIPKQSDQVEDGSKQAVEQVSTQELPSPSSPAPINPVVATDPAQVAQPATNITLDQTSVAQPVVATSGLKADDADLIEKQWVQKAKNIVEQTKNDPYMQNNELSKVKADYIGKRFNKQLKNPEDSKA